MEDGDILRLAGIDKCLYVGSFVLYQYFRGQYTKLPLQQVHQQAAGSSVAISPRVNGHQLVMRPETEVVNGAHIRRVYRFAAFVQIIAKGRQTFRHLEIGHIRFPTRTGTDVQFAQLAFGGGKIATHNAILASGAGHHLRGQHDEPVNGDGLVLLNPLATIVVGILEVEVHQLFQHGALAGGDALVEEQLRLHLGHRAAFNGSGMHNDGVQIELVVVYLRGDAQLAMAVEQLQQFVPVLIRHYNVNFSAKIHIFSTISS